MFNAGYKKQALKEAKAAAEEYKQQYDSTIESTEQLHDLKVQSVKILEDVENYINSLANTPKTLKKTMAEVKVHRLAFEDKVQRIINESEKMDKISAGTAGAGAVAGVGVAAFGPTAAMAIATTFGTASTGTAIATLSGAAATNAALAWLGGGALAVGGGGMAAGEAFLAMAGPVGWAIGGAAILGGGLLANSKNKEAARKAKEQTRKMKEEKEKLKEISVKVDKERKAITDLNIKVKQHLEQMKQCPKRDYKQLTDDESMVLTILVNAARSLGQEIEKELK